MCVSSWQPTLSVAGSRCLTESVKAMQIWQFCIAESCLRAGRNYFSFLQNSFLKIPSGYLCGDTYAKLEVTRSCKQFRRVRMSECSSFIYHIRSGVPCVAWSRLVLFGGEYQEHPATSPLPREDTSHWRPQDASLNAQIVYRWRILDGRLS